jgi:peptide/nickel transport system substrate-binding protein
MSQPVGAGPFLLKDWVRNSTMTFVRNPNYWNAPRPYVDQVIFRPIADEQQRINSFKAGEANMIWTNQPESGDQISKAGGVAKPLVFNGGTPIWFNLRRAPFNDIRARRAVVLAIDRVAYTHIVKRDLIQPQDSIFRPDSLFYDPNIVQLGYDPVEAQRLFDQLAAEQGGTFSFVLGTFETSFNRAQAEYFAGVLSQFNHVKVTVDVASTSAAVARINAGNYQAHVSGNPFDDPDPIWVNTFISTAKPSITGFADPQFDADMQTARKTFDANVRIAAYKDAQRIIYAQVPAMYYERRYIYMFGRPNVMNLTIFEDAIPFLDRIWIKSS